MNNITKPAIALSALAFALCLLGCSPQSAEEQGVESAHAGREEGASASTAWSPASDCASCHEAETASMEDSATPASIHGEEGATCSTCHADEAELETAHEGASATSAMPERAEMTEVAESTCSSCHGADEELAAKTAGSEALADARATVVNPHALPDVADHASIACSDCHKMHASDPPAHTAKEKCATCHHQNVYECYTCHE